MDKLTTLGGLAGACALTLLHEGVRRIDSDAPRLDTLGKNALVKGLKSLDQQVPGKNKLFNLALAGDIIGNTLYYSRVGGGSGQLVWLRGAVLGLGAGLGAVFMPKPLGLNEDASGRSAKTKVLTVAMYLLGGLVASAVINYMQNRSVQRSVAA